MAPRIVDKEERRRSIASAAFGVFVDKGFDALSIAEVARAAGIGKGTVYEYFDSKEELVLAGVVVWTEELEAGVEAAIDPSQSPEERLRAMCAGTMHAFMSDPTIIRAFISSMSLMFFNEKFREANLWKAIYTRFGQIITQTILEGVADGSFRAEVARDAEKIAVNLFTYLDGIGMHWMLSAESFDLHEQIECYLEQLFSTMRANGRSQRGGS